MSAWRSGVAQWGKRAEIVAALATFAGWATCFADPIGPVILAVGCGLALPAASALWATPASGANQHARRAAQLLGVALFFAAAVTMAVLGNTHVGYAIVGLGYGTLIVRGLLIAWAQRHGGIRHTLRCVAMETVPLAGLVLRPAR